MVNLLPTIILKLSIAKNMSIHLCCCEYCGNFLFLLCLTALTLELHFVIDYNIADFGKAILSKNHNY